MIRFSHSLCSRFCSFLSLAVLLTYCMSTTAADTESGSKKKRQRKRPPNPAMAPVEDVAGLPRVLLIGDSISIGYTVPTRKILEGKANVHRPLTNCGPTTKGVQEIDKWLGDGDWDVIHFNWGLHDLKYMGPQGQNLADPNGADSRQQVPIDEYEKNLRLLVDRLRKTRATLIWRSTTPVPEGAAGRVVGDAVKYNAVAAKIMAEHRIAIDDQYTLVMEKLQKTQRPANVHFTADGSAALAASTAASILKVLDRE